MDDFTKKDKYSSLNSAIKDIVQQNNDLYQKSLCEKFGIKDEQSEPKQVEEVVQLQEKAKKFTPQQIAYLEGIITFSRNGKRIQDIDADIEGDVSGNIKGDIRGKVVGVVDGNIGAGVGGNIGGEVYGDIKGSVHGTISGNVSGNVVGQVDGKVLNRKVRYK